MQSGIDPAANARMLVAAIETAAEGGAAILFTPEMSGLLDKDRKRAASHVVSESENEVLKTVRNAARDNSIWLALGSLAVATEQTRWANRSLLIDGQGDVVARYDKMHMFDVDLHSGETWRESNVYRPGDIVVSADTPVGRMGFSICYDMRFPALFDALGHERCDFIACPAAFTVPTGKVHWHVLLRARAIEASAYIIAAAQIGHHEDGRTTYGHSLVIDPWGEILLDMGEDVNAVAFADIDLSRIAAVRQQVPSLANRRKIDK